MLQIIKRAINHPYLRRPIATTATATVVMDESTLQLELPGFRFHPTEEELLDFYLKKMALGKNMRFDIIGFLNIYRHDPWDLPGLAKIGEREWYFFVPRDRKQGSGGRPNRTTEHGFWKATGSDRKIFSLSDPKRPLGLKKTLVFYKGRAPRGSKTDWVMSEYRLLDSCTLPKDIVLCKIYRKATSLKVLEQRAAMEELETNRVLLFDHANSTSTPSSPISTPPMDTMSFSSQSYDDFLPVPPPMSEGHVALTKNEDQDLLHEMAVGEKLKEKVKEEEEEEIDGTVNSSSSSLKLPSGMDNLGGGLQLQLPKFNMDWTQDSFWTQLRSPWLDNLTLTPYANILNF